jgi:DNA topoisomerase-1
MRAAQQLYEAGDITYMRTDSTTLAKEAQNQALALVDDEYGQDYTKKRNYTTDDESAQEAHEAVRPTNLSNRDAGTNSVQKKVYDLIWRQTVASQMTAAQILQTKVVVQVGDGDIPHFKINGSRTVFDGWLKVNPHARGEDTHVPELKEGQTLDLQEIHTEKKQTKPPRRYTEAGLVKELEKRGIGRPSTYANIMQKLQQRDYVNKDGKSLVPTDTGNVVSSFLEDHFTRYISDDFTARMENELDAIAAGESEYVATLEDFYTDFSDAIESKEDMDKITNLGPAPDEYDCPECDGDMIIKLGKNGKFMSCADFPDCQGARTMEGKDISEGEPLGTYSDTDTMMFKKEGPYGPYIQLGEDNEDEADPKRVSIPDDVDPDTITREHAEKLLALPRTLGEHPDTGNEIRADIGPYGPYVAEIKDEGKPDYYSIDDEDLSVHTIDQDAALDIIKEDS